MPPNKGNEVDSLPPNIFDIDVDAVEFPKVEVAD